MIPLWTMLFLHQQNNARLRKHIECDQSVAWAPLPRFQTNLLEALVTRSFVQTLFAANASNISSVDITNEICIFVEIFVSLGSKLSFVQTFICDILVFLVWVVS